MPTTVQSSIGSAVATSTGDPTSEPDASSTVYTSDTTFVLMTGGDTSASGGLGAQVLADGAAFGTNTLTTLDVTATVVGHGTYADALSAMVMVTGAAQSPDGSAIALTTAMIELIGGATVMIGITHTSSMTVTAGQSQTSVSVAFASLDALQVDTDGTGSVDPETPGCGCHDPEAGGGAPDPADTAGEQSVFDAVNLDGNLSIFDIAASAFGDNTLVEVSFDAIASRGSILGRDCGDLRRDRLTRPARVRCHHRSCHARRPRSASTQRSSHLTHESLPASSLRRPLAIHTGSCISTSVQKYRSSRAARAIRPSSDTTSAALPSHLLTHRVRLRSVQPPDLKLKGEAK